MVETLGLIIWRRGHLQWYDLSAEFLLSLLIGSKVISVGQPEGQTYRQTGVLASLTFTFKGTQAKNAGIYL
jgi:hypothetical protein